MIKLSSTFVEQSSQLLTAILNERKMKLTDFKRVYYCCPWPYSQLADDMYEQIFNEYKFDSKFFTYETNLDALNSLSIMVGFD